MRPCAFPASCRIRTGAEYDRAFEAGRSFHAPHFRLVVAPGRLAWSRLGVIASRKVGKAHDRNRLRRRVREWFRLRRAAWPFRVDLVVLAKPGAAALEYAAVAAELDGLLSQWRERSQSG